MATTNIFLTGASGYIGGSVLHALLNSPNASKYSITTLVRGEKDIEKIKTLGVNVLKGSLDDLDLLFEQSAAADIVIHTASSHAVDVAQKISAGLSKRRAEGKMAFLIHTSGASILADGANGEFYGEKEHRDTDDIYAFEKADTSGSPVHGVDITFIEAGKKGDFGVSIVTPPTIYGAGTGLVRRTTHQVHYTIQSAIKFRKTYQLGKGLSAWNHVHIEDLAALYVTIVDAIREGKIPQDRRCHYFAETGEHTWKSLSETIARLLHARGLVDSPEVLQWPSLQQAADSLIWGITPYVQKAFSSNSRGRAVRGREIGWKPKHTNEDFFNSMEEQIDFTIANPN